MKKALIYASVASMIEQFNMDNIKTLLDLGYEVDIACNFEFGSSISIEKIEEMKARLTEMKVGFYHIPIPRKLTNIKNLSSSYIKSRNLLNEKKYDVVHCHSPIGSVICRLANKKSKNYNFTKMIYTAHGFHFFKGNSTIKNFFFKSIEKRFAKYTDVLITINKEDFEAAKQFETKKNGKVLRIPGIGINTEKIISISSNKKALLRELGIPRNSILLLSVGELNYNKNHKIILEIMHELPDNIHYLICGLGPLKNHYLEIARRESIENRVHLLGFRNDVISVMKAADIFVFPSRREGLGLAAIEAMACGLPLVTSNRHGILDYAKHNYNSLVCEPDNHNQFVKAIKTLCLDSELSKQFGKRNILEAQNYDVKVIRELMKKIYI